jgi:methylated-DNA-[protein]-cysteine S-methyltransferase
MSAATLVEMLTSRTIDSPVGPLTIAGTDGVVHHLRMDAQSYPPKGQDAWRNDDDSFGEAVDQLHAYFAGELRAFDVPLHLDGTEFQQRVWRALLEIPFGETRTYGALATRVGAPAAARAVGLANGHNPIGIIVPCHRVIGADGSLTGYGGGIDRKRRLLEHERTISGGALTLFA